MTLRFGITYDYLCPFARNANEHVVAGLRDGAAWDVTFEPYSLRQNKVEEGEQAIWDRDRPLRASGILALAVAEVVRVRDPERFPAVHLELFALRHDRGEDLREPARVAEALARAGADPALVDAAAEGLPALRERHERMVTREVWGVPTFLGAERAVFVRILDRPEGDAARARARIERVVGLVDGEPMLHEFKQVDLPR
jgi:hypothetical protein